MQRYKNLCQNCDQDTLIISSVVMLALFQNSEQEKAFEFEIECKSCGFKEPAIISSRSAIGAFYSDPFVEDEAACNDWLTWMENTK